MSNDWDIYDINRKPTKRWGWWLMVKFTWDSIFNRR